MVRKLFLTLLIFAQISIFLVTGRRIRKGKEQPIQPRREEYYVTINICSIESNSEAVNCFCDQNIPLQATSATCWIFGQLNKSDTERWTRFKTQPNLTSLTLTMRPTEVFTFIPTQVFIMLRKLANFDLKYASIETVEPYAFANLSSLIQLHLSRNKIASLSSYSFAHLTNLLEVNLEENQLTEIKRNVFYELPRLRKLFLASNNISKIFDGAFKYLGALLELELKQNVFTVINRDCFLGLSNLKRLDLSMNLISVLDDLTFAELWHLEELILDSNQLKAVNRKTFFGLNHLRRLTLSENYLTTLDSRLFEDTPAINFLDLRANNLITLTLENIRPIFSNFLNDSSYFFLERNKLECDCRLTWIFDLHNETRNKHIRRDLEKLICLTKPDDDLFASVTPKPSLPNSIYDDYDDSYEYEDDLLPISKETSSNTKKAASAVRKHYLFQIGREQLTCKLMVRPLNDVDSNQIAIEQQQSLSGGPNSRVIHRLFFLFQFVFAIIFIRFI